MGESGRSLGEAGRGFEEEGAARAPARGGHLVIRDYLRRLDDAPGRLPDARRQGRRALRRQGAQPQEAVAAYAKPRAPTRA